ncbi:MAG: hypothetical protein ACLR02_09745 [Clostridium sp.]
MKTYKEFDEYFSELINDNDDLKQEYREELKEGLITEEECDLLFDQADGDLDTQFYIVAGWMEEHLTDKECCEILEKYNIYL